MAASTTSHRAIKGILKNEACTASSVAAPAQQHGGAIEGTLRKNSQKWDESNVLATYRPTEKDCGLEKNKPSTPYFAMLDDGEDPASDLETREAMIPDTLAKKAVARETLEPKPQVDEQESSGEEDHSILCDKEEKQPQFEMKRKLHYNEGLSIKLARQLISKDLQGEEMKRKKVRILPMKKAL
ncbi:protein phosphatase inhibitor 2 family member C [Tamandua tetradactyla]|uniref:protein phosphatase inhibitor 2 family member C n=1 Tax=Tamandua tetradactyla TaxID=48850 RepID=UPI004053CE1A